MGNADNPEISGYPVSVGKDFRYVYGAVISGDFKEMIFFEQSVNMMVK